MKDAFNWYDFDSKNMYFKQYKDSKYAVNLTKQSFKDKNFNAN
jgi:hypothetical protein